MTFEHSEYFRTPKPRPIMAPKLHDATFMTMDVAAMVRFYEAVCGLQPVYYAEHAAWLTNDEANHRIALLRLPGRPGLIAWPGRPKEDGMVLSGNGGWPS